MKLSPEGYGVYHDLDWHAALQHMWLMQLQWVPHRMTRSAITPYKMMADHKMSSLLRLIIVMGCPSGKELGFLMSCWD